jgi:hypothetical protein
MTAAARRACVLAVVVAASLVAISVARAAFDSSASAGPQPFSSASLSAPGSPGGTCQNGTATITWTATSSAFAAGYQILRGSVSGGPYTLRATITPRTTTSYNDTNLTGSTRWYYVVRAFKQNWTSASTAQVTVDSSNC